MRLSGRVEVGFYLSLSGRWLISLRWRLRGKSSAYVKGIVLSMYFLLKRHHPTNFAVIAFTLVEVRDASARSPKRHIRAC